MRCPAPAQPFNLSANPLPRLSTQDNNAISKADSEGFLNETATTEQIQDASSKSESDKIDLGLQ